MCTYQRNGRITEVKELKQSLISLLVLFGIIYSGLSVDPNTIVAETDNMDDLPTQENLSLDDFDVQDIPDIYGTSPDTTFKFMFNGRVLEPEESILVCTAAPGQPCHEKDEEQ
ncbi:hypothetical protein [Paenibacillus sp. DCT19]|uniref:hypothetical protein n=1 Tax=Paenibacillus sp. DCT19 TaxID=2211212 RepID=UPI000FE1A43A|nr:hypothetical protein [Paenibacillus sp. DCT19]